MAEEGGREIGYRVEAKVEERMVGNLRKVEIRAETAIEAYRRLGELESRDAGIYIEGQLGGEREEERAEKLREGVRFARLCRQRTEENLIRNVAEDDGEGKMVKEAWGEYLACGRAFVEGGQMAEKAMGVTGVVAVDGVEITAEEVFLWLQNDNSGCQTGMIRLRDGGVAYWHTEEESDMRFEGREEPGDERRLRFEQKPTMVKMVIGCGVERDEFTSFAYPFLLPGGGVSYGQGYFQGVDALYLADPPEEGGALANSAVWVMNRLRGKVGAEAVVKTMGPFVDGYAVKIAEPNGSGKITGRRMVFAGDQVKTDVLGSAPGESLYQHNMLPKGYRAPKLRPYIDEGGGEQENFRRREMVNRTLLGVIKEAIVSGKNDDLVTLTLLRLMSSRVGRLIEPQSKEDGPRPENIAYANASPWLHVGVAGRMRLSAAMEILEIGGIVTKDNSVKLRVLTEGGVNGEDLELILAGMGITREEL